MKIQKKDTRPVVKVAAALLAREYDLLTVQAMKSGYSPKEMAEVVLRTWLGTVRATPDELEEAARLNAKPEAEEKLKVTTRPKPATTPTGSKIVNGIHP
jgi:hypothetical protein